MKMRGIIKKSLSAVAYINIGLLGLFASCFDDNFDSTMKLEALPYEILVTDIGNVAGNPVPGNCGLITTLAESTSIRLSWVRATDAKTPQSDLEYSLYRSSTNNISTPEQAELNGISLTGWSRDMITTVADSLTPGTTYYFNVIVRDSDGNRAAYITVSVVTLSDAVYLFSTGPHTGALTTPTTASARADVDSFCTAAKNSAYPELPCINVHTFISISSSDYIAYMPKKFGLPVNRKIIGPTGVQIAADWYDLLDGTIADQLQNAGISDTYWWSGSDTAGSYLLAESCVGCNTCSGWTVGTNASQGMTGAHNRTDPTWIADRGRNCNSELNILCVCW
ncbi:MAG: hypothetical protein A2176_11065 [Spirochaetes bacterium RBG_13_51_14]|nr:MAG: hypothetical protein A2176_11065 [Spirochaetes bacterium RBG_13_51_14]